MGCRDGLFCFEAERLGAARVVGIPGLVRDVLVDDGTLVIETAVIVDGNRHALLDCPPGEDERLVVDRATIVCRRDASLIKHKVAAYWDGLHDLYATSATSLE